MSVAPAAPFPHSAPWQFPGHTQVDFRVVEMGWIQGMEMGTQKQMPQKKSNL